MVSVTNIPIDKRQDCDPDSSLKSAMIHAAVALLSLLAVTSVAYESDDPASRVFAHQFADILRKDPIDAKVFDIVLIGGKAAAPVYRQVVSAFLQKKGRSPEDSRRFADQIAEVVARTYDHLDPDTKAVLVGYNLANALRLTGHLDQDKASELAQQAAQDYDKIAHRQELNSPEAKVECICKGYVKFLKRFGVKYEDIVDKFVANDVKMLPP